MAKIRRHIQSAPNDSTMPPMNGPIDVVSDEKAAQVPIALPRVAAGYDLAMIARLPGTINAAPMPCAARVTISIWASVDSAQASDIAMNTAMPVAKMLRTPNTSPAAPPSSTSAERNSM